jgi:hypothetical protein
MAMRQSDPIGDLPLGSLTEMFVSYVRSPMSSGLRHGFAPPVRDVNQDLQNLQKWWANRRNLGIN